jgi:hypothetical protein
MQVLARLLTWFAGGALLYTGMAVTARALSWQFWPLERCWVGGITFIGIELVVHALMALRGLPNLYDGRA